MFSLAGFTSSWSVVVFLPLTACTLLPESNRLKNSTHKKTSFASCYPQGLEDLVSTWQLLTSSYSTTAIGYLPSPAGDCAWSNHTLEPTNGHSSHGFQATVFTLWLIFVDRCHRIGQTKTVKVFRLATASRYSFYFSLTSLMAEASRVEC